MRLITYLFIPMAGSFASLWWSLMLFQTNRIMESLLVSSLVTTIILGAVFVRLSKVSGFFFSVAITVGFCVLWSFLWAVAEEGYIHFFVLDGTSETGIGKSRYIYPGHSGMGNAHGLLHYFRNLPAILFYGMILGVASGFFGLVFQRGTRNLATAESGSSNGG